METTTIEKVFALLNDLAEIWGDDLQLDPVDALIEAADFWITGEVKEMALSESALYRLEKRVAELPFASLRTEEAYQGWHYALLKLLHQYAQPNHQMTPDTVVILLNHFASLLLKEKETLRIYDPAVGSGHLLLQFVRALSGRVSAVVANDVDEAMLDFAAIGASLNQVELQLENFDAAATRPAGVFDVVVSDLPIEHEKDVAIIEQSAAVLNAGGFFFLVVPINWIEGEEAGRMITLLKSSLVLNAFIKLPRNLFAKNAQQKGLLLLRKKGPGVTQLKQVLLAEMPLLSNQEATKEMLRQIDAWFEMEMGETI